jgi:hypothetical protein
LYPKDWKAEATADRMTHGEFFKVFLVLKPWTLQHQPRNDKNKGAQWKIQK